MCKKQLEEKERPTLTHSDSILKDQLSTNLQLFRLETKFFNKKIIKELKPAFK
jgi:hypothetical protein